MTASEESGGFHRRAGESRVLSLARLRSASDVIPNIADVVTWSTDSIR
jgi:hypothetical protein